MTLIATAAGLALQAQNLSAGTMSQIDKIKAGSGSQAPAASLTDILTPFSPVKEIDNPSGDVDAARMSVRYIDESPASGYTINEYGYFAGSTMVAYEGDASGLGEVVTAGQLFIHEAVIIFANNSLSTFTFASPSNAPDWSTVTAGKVRRATQAEETAGSSETLGVSVAGTKRMIGTFTVGLPAGVILPYGGTTLPSDEWAWCDGGTENRQEGGADTPLFSAIGTTWGAGDGSTTYNRPDLRGYALAGAGGTSVLGSALDAVGNKGGSKDAVNVTHGHANHGHRILSDFTGNTDATYPHTKVVGRMDNPGQGHYVTGATYSEQSTGTFGINLNHPWIEANSIPSNGESGTGKNVQPTAVVNFIIKL